MASPTRLRRSYPAATFALREHWIGTLRGRLGFKFGADDQFLLYATGGAAAAGVTATTSLPGVFSVSATNTMNGWTAGGGGEWAVFPPTPTPHGWLSIKVEYLYVDLGAKDFVLDPTLTTSKNVSLIDHIVRAGVNWHF
jgi:outer membrane immunogenic protein